MKPFHDMKVEYFDFKKYIKDKIERLRVDEVDIDLLLNLCDFYLKENDLSLLHADIHFDNVIINGDDIKLIDFERSMVGAIDYEFRILAICRKRPYLWASAETDMLQTDYDFKDVIKIVKKYYPRLNNVKYLEERFTIYELIQDLKAYKASRLLKIKDDINAKIKRLRR